MKREFILSYRKAAFKPVSYAVAFMAGGLFSHYSFKTVDAYQLFFLSYFFFAASFYFLIISLLFVLRRDRKYVLLTESTLTILCERFSIEIPRSEISLVRLCESPIRYRMFIPYGPVDLGGISTALKISLRDSKLLGGMVAISDYKREFFQSQSVHISDDKKEIYLRSSPVGGFEPLLSALKDPT